MWKIIAVLVILIAAVGCAGQPGKAPVEINPPPAHSQPTVTAPAPAAPTATTVGMPTPESTASRVDAAEAEELITAWIKAAVPGMNPAVTYPLDEITTPETWDRIGAQVFKVNAGERANESYLIYHRAVYPIGQSFGGTGIYDMQVTDLDGDGAPELVYAYAFGSGFAQSALGVFITSGAAPRAEEMLSARYPGTLRLVKKDDRTLLIQGVKAEATQDRGALEMLDGRPVLRLPPMIDEAQTIYTSQRYGVSFAYPTGWQRVDASTGVERYQGEDGFFELSAVAVDSDVNALVRACETEANGSPALYGDHPAIRFAVWANPRPACLIISNSIQPGPHSAILFADGQGHIARLSIDPGRAEQVLQTLRFTRVLPTLTPAPLRMEGQVTIAARAETRFLSPLMLRELQVVPASVDTPTHFEFKALIPADTYPRRAAWGKDLFTLRLASANQQLAPFGYRLEAKGAQADLYHGAELVRGDLSYFFPPATYRDDSGAGDFAMVIEDSQGRQWLVRGSGIEQWDYMLHRQTRPVFVGTHLITYEQRPAAAGEDGDTAVILQDGQPVFTYALAPSPVVDPVRALDEWNGSWVLEVNGVLLVGGSNWNAKELHADEVFQWTKIDGKPFFFVRRASTITAWYDGQELPAKWDEILHNQCCEPAIFNPEHSPNALWFYALRDGWWYYAEIAGKP